jgi:hypothetical protein
MAEENFATNGNTVKDEIEQLERTLNEDYGVVKSISSATSHKIKSNSSHANTRSTSNTRPAPLSPFNSAMSPETSLTTPVDEISQKAINRRERIFQKCKSIIQLFWH